MPVPILGRRRPGHFLEQCYEIRRTGHTYSKSNIRYRFIRIGQKLLGHVHAQLLNVFAGRHSFYPLEGAAQMIRTAVAHFRQDFQCYIFTEMAVNEMRNLIDPLAVGQTLSSRLASLAWAKMGCQGLLRVLKDPDILFIRRPGFARRPAKNTGRFDGVKN